MRLRRARVVARARDADALGEHVRHAHRSRERLADREAADHVVARDHPPRHPDRVVDEVAARGVERRGAALRVGVRAGEPADRDHREPVRHLDDVARRPHAGREVRMRSSTMIAAGRAELEPGGLGERARSGACAGRRSPRRTRARPRGSRRRARGPVADEALDARAEPQRHAALARATRAPARRRPGRAPPRAPTGPRRRSRPAGPRWPRLPAISTPSGVGADHHDALHAVERLSNSIAARMSLT